MKDLNNDIYLHFETYQRISSEEQKDLDLLLNECKSRLKKHNEKNIKKAYFICLEAHKNQIQANGQPYYKHPLSVAITSIRDFKLDDVSVICSLMCEVLNYSNDFTLDYIKKEFGETVSEIIDGITQIKAIEENYINNMNFLDNFRKILFSLFKDVRIALIKLSERLSLLRVISNSPDEKNIKIAKEVMEVYVPYANRFGLRNIKWEMEDLFFKTTNPIAYEEIREKLDGTREEREEYVSNFLEPIKAHLEKDEMLSKNNVTWELSGRVKHIYSIFNKIIIRQKPMEELYDLIAVRIILDTNDKNLCFYAYGIVADIYPPVPETFKDYINASKQNGYQSIHVAVLGPKQTPVEVQFRTKSMHYTAENGVAAHFNYKPGLVPAHSVFENQHAQEWMNYVKEIFENAEEDNTQELLDSVRQNLFLEEIHVFSPKNQLYTFPKNATPLDFAFNIHSELGYHCVGAKANSKIVPLNYKMQSGDQIEILTSSKQFPNQEWIKWVITSKSKSLIYKFLKQDDKISYFEGLELWEKTIKENNLRYNKKYEKVLLAEFGFSNMKEFIIAFARQKFYVYDIVNFFKKQNNKSTFISSKKETNRKSLNNSIFANPYASSFNINFIIRGDDRPGLVKDITTLIIGQENTMLNGVSFDSYKGNFLGTISVEIKDANSLSQLIYDINLVENVKTIDWVEK
ncbi:MAG: HD domain-containing protein [Candidatus Kapabacteria bacterium]|nr:HD domain-containing protein [Candidatus Kapabacteria bacterium]